jgi:hypothetical protein
MNAAMARVTVLMPVHDGAAYLQAAIDSILAQTYRDLELVVVDDGSTDASADIVRACRDPRVRLERHARNLGLIATLNEGLDQVRTEYLARMDCDDLAHPERLARQIAHLDRNPHVAVLGTAVENFGAQRGVYALPTSHGAIRARLLFDWAIAHPTVVLRPAVLRELGLRYDPANLHAEDHALWIEVSARAGVENLPDRLLRYRHHARQVSRRKADEQQACMHRTCVRALALAGLAATPDEATLHRQIATAAGFEPSPAFLERAEAWLLRIREACGPAFGERDAAALQQELANRWARLCRRSRALGLEAWRRFRRSPLREGALPIRAAEVLLGAVAGAARRRRG